MAAAAKEEECAEVQVASSVVVMVETMVKEVAATEMAAAAI
jgi:hypothetical protein